MATVENFTITEILAMSARIEAEEVELIADLQNDKIADPNGESQVFPYENSSIFAVERESEEVILVTFHDDSVVAFPNDHVLELVVVNK